MHPSPVRRSYNALRSARIEETVRKGGFTYLGTDINGVDLYRYEWPDSTEHTYVLMAWDWVVVACTCTDFERRHLPCKHCDALQIDLWTAEQLKRAKKRDFERRLAATIHGCWGEMPLGSGNIVWMEEFGLSEAELRKVRDLFDRDGSEINGSEINGSEINGSETSEIQANEIQTARRRGNVSGLEIERIFRHAQAQYTT